MHSKTKNFDMFPPPHLKLAMSPLLENWSKIHVVAGDMSMPALVPFLLVQKVFGMAMLDFGMVVPNLYCRQGINGSLQEKYTSNVGVKVSSPHSVVL